MNPTSHGGFTLIEMVVAITIISILGSILLGGFVNDGTQFTLESETQNVVAEIRVTQSLASSASPFDDPPFNGTVPSSYGLYFAEGSNEIIIFGDLANPLPNQVYDPGVDGVVKTITLDDDLTISSVTPTASLSIVYTPPHAQGTINGDALVDEAQVVIEPVQNPKNRSRTIVLNKVSLVDVEQ